MSSQPAPDTLAPRPRRPSPDLRAAAPGTRSGGPFVAFVPTAVGAPLVAAFVSAALLASGMSAQQPVAVPPPPDQPMAEDFDPDRALFFAEPNFIPLRNPEWKPLEEALDDDVAEDTPVLLFEAGGRTLVLVSSQMSYHHVAQGEMAGEPWMVTF